VFGWVLFLSGAEAPGGVPAHRFTLALRADATSAARAPGIPVRSNNRRSAARVRRPAGAPAWGTSQRRAGS